MIPTEKQCKALWEKYHLPQAKRVHVLCVARVALWLAKQCKVKSEKCKVNDKLLLAGALLHDIDKAVEKLPGEQHPDTAVRLLREEGMEEVSSLVKTHSLHAILDPALSPKTWEEKLLYLADKMCKHEVVGVDGRFALWRAENLPEEAVKTMNACYPRVKELEKEIFDVIGVGEAEMNVVFGR